MRSKAFRAVLWFAAGAVFLFSAVMVLKYHVEMRAGARQTEALVQSAVVQPSAQPLPVPSEAPSAAPQPTAEAAADDPYPLPIEVDFDVLKAQNPDVAAWLYCPDTLIHYPVVQTTDNETYLTRLFDGSKNPAGTLFLDYRNAADLHDRNSIIYGHNMNNDSMFGTLTEYASQAYYDAHPTFYLLTPQANYVVHIFAGFVTAGDDELYNALSADEATQTRLLRDWLSASDFTAAFTPSAQDRLLLLSTCSYEYNDARYIVIGVLQEVS